MLIQNTKRNNITVDDRRSVIAAARSFKPTVAMSRQHFIINELKARLNWPAKEKASDSMLEAADSMAAYLSRVEKENRAIMEAKSLAEKVAKEAAC